MANISFKSVALTGINKKSEYKRDGEYYYVCLGALNIFNSTGDFYDAEASRAAFDASTVFKRTCLAGNQYGEDNHPEWEAWMDEKAFLARNERVVTERRALYIREVDLIETDRHCNNLPVVEIWGWIKPFGDKGPQLKEALDDPHQNVCFSIRAWIKDKVVNGIKWMMIDELITVDWVPEPGVSVSSKYYVEYDYKIQNEKLPRTLMLESFSVPLTERVLRDIAESQRTVTKERRLGRESYLGRQVEELSKRSQGVIIKKGGLVDNPWL